MSKHTPGPFIVRPPGHNGGNYCILAPEKENGWSSVVAILTPRNDMLVEANAALFAAAPEMLEALKQAVSACPCSFKERDSGHRIDCCAPVWLDIIAKAEGRS